MSNIFSAAVGNRPNLVWKYRKSYMGPLTVREFDNQMSYGVHFQIVFDSPKGFEDNAVGYYDRGDH